MKSKIDEYEIIKTLGYGMVGTTYLIKKEDKKEYALKIEKILEKDVKKSTNSPVWREIEFCKFMNKKYPGLFMSLYNYDIINECEHEQKYIIPVSNFPKKIQKAFIKHSESKYCSRKIYSLIDNSLQNEIKENKIKSKEELLSIIIQLGYSIFISHLHNYTHNDIHSGNIGIIYTNEKYMDIFGNKIPLFGRKIQLIDYGTILNSKYELGKGTFGNEKYKYKTSLLYELFNSLVALLFYSSDLTKFWIENPIDNDRFMRNCELILESPEGKLLQNLIEKPKKGNREELLKYKYDISDLLMILDNEKWQEYILNNNSDKLEKPKDFKPMKIKFFFDFEDYLYFYKNGVTKDIKQKEKLLKYFIDKLLN